MKFKYTHKIMTAIIFLLAGLLTFSSLGFTAAVNKNETVFVSLDYQGQATNIEIVNWAQASGKLGPQGWTDWGNYNQVENLTGPQQPEREGDKLIWPEEAFQNGNLFYRGTIDQELPLGIEIDYWLNGQEIEPERLPGAAGELKISINITNLLEKEQEITYAGYQQKNLSRTEQYYIPLMVQVSLEVDLENFRDIRCPDAIKTVVGRTMNISFATIPYPEQEFTVTMVSDHIELNPINIVAFPSEIPQAEYQDLSQDLNDLADGLGQISEALSEASQGTEKFKDGVAELKQGTVELVDAISSINHGAYALSKNADKITGGLSGLAKGSETFYEQSQQLLPGAEHLAQSVTPMGDALKQLDSGAMDLARGTGQFQEGLNLLASTNDSLAMAAQAALSDPELNVLLASDPELLGQVQAVLNGVLAERIILQGDSSPANPGLKSAAAGINQGAAEISKGISGFYQGFNNFSQGMAQFLEQIKNLPPAIGQLNEGIEKLYAGWNSYSQGIGDLYSGTQKLWDNIQGIPQDIGQMQQHINDLAQGISEINEQGVEEINSELGQGIDQINLGLKLQETINLSAENYSSFAHQDNTSSQVQFVMRTPAMETPQELVPGTEPDPPKTFWEKLLELFKP